MRSLRLGEGIDGRSNVKEEPHDFDDLPPEVREALLKRSATRNPERSTLSKLEGKYMMALLIYLDRMSPVLKSDIYNDISRSGRMTDKLNDLLSMGLIEMYRTGRTDSKVIVITDKGRKVAGIISEMIGIIEGDMAKKD
ncbi:hypothetical protein PED39_00665 [Methanomassiliicoccales archaeon LGM-RCC1]|nr:hypothetical protein PED39_00665 [Methanomassiliicoccales archaeon LGM-RCC1]